MSNIYNLVGNDNVVTFNLGTTELSVRLNDENSEKISRKAIELKEQADAIDEKEDIWKARKELKTILDALLSEVFGEDDAQKLYEFAGEDTTTYLSVFLQIAEAIKLEQEKKNNDENFKKYLAE